MASVHCNKCDKFIGNVTDMPDMIQQVMKLGESHEKECSAAKKKAAAHSRKNP
jgi:hypothetical protein